MLQEKNVEPQTLNFSETSQLFLARLGSVRLGVEIVYIVSGLIWVDRKEEEDPMTPPTSSVLPHCFLSQPGFG